ncbi:MAG: amidohydrolase family protein, partial [Nonomuraea sp.]|nr:amidohydrolase family protein [Nonomuraea sp.]
MERISADVLIPGSGEPVEHGVVVLDGATIAYAGPAAGAPATPGAVESRAAAVMPGLWDCHNHLMG